MKDTLGLANMSPVERLSTLQRWKCISTIYIGKSIFLVHLKVSFVYREVLSMVSFNRGFTVHRWNIPSVVKFHGVKISSS